jgi:hypothetical protein
MQFEDSQTLYILIPYNQTKWTKTAWKALEESIRRGGNWLLRPTSLWMMMMMMMMIMMMTTTTTTSNNSTEGARSSRMEVGELL